MASMRPTMTCIAFLASLGLSLGGCSDTTPTPAATTGSPTFYQSLNAGNVAVDPVAARDMISVYRHNHGLATLTIDSVLQDEARAQVDAMAKANEVSHTVRGTLASRISKSSTPRAAAVENVSAGYHTLAEAFSGWRESKPHNDNMLNPRVRRMGIATAYVPGSKYKVFWALVMTD
jgi:uncharacterized protein YkwD